MSTKFRFLLLFVAVFLVACNDDEEDGDNGIVTPTNVNCNDARSVPELARLEFPKLKSSGNNRLLIYSNHDNFGINYSVEWDADKKSQRWSCYQLTAANRVSRTNRYYPDKSQGEVQYPFDTQLPAKAYFATDPFYGSGFDHGHICPSADRLYSRATNIQTFYLTNMQPQYNAFNSKLWAKMEAKVRSWVNTGSKPTDTLFVCKGGTIDVVTSEGGISRPLLTTLSNGLRVPRYFYMAVLLKTQKSGYSAMAFWAEHLNENHENDPLGGYVINVHELERRTGIDFFCNLPDDIEQQVENMSEENIRWIFNL
jgi:endonuclease G